jgi:hypothetical protein
VKNTKTAHQVFIIENTGQESVSFTCGQLDGATTNGLAKTASSIKIGGAVGAANALLYTECIVNGSLALTIDMNGCKYNLTASGTATITGCTNATKSIEATFATASGKCVIGIPEQGPLSTVKYHNIGTTPKREVTVELNISPIKVTATGTKATCLIDPSQSLTPTQTTGNVIVTGETAAGVQLDAWWE